MELHADDRRVLCAERRDRQCLCSCDGDESGRRLIDMIAMTGPNGDRLADVEAFEKWVRSLQHDLRTAVLAMTGLDLAAPQMRYGLHAVTHRQDRYAEVEDACIRQRHVIVVHRVGAAG